MKQTANYQLNQWDADDRILRTDFNADNAKIDAALKTQSDALAAETTAREAGVSALSSKAGSQLIRTVRSPANAATVALDLSAVDWGAWNTMYLTLTPVVSGSGVVSVYVDGEVIGRMSASGGAAQIILCPAYSAALPVWGVFLSVSGANAFAVREKFSDFTSLELRASSEVLIQRDTKLVIRGMK